MNNSDNINKIQSIASYYGFNSQSMQCMEEMAELAKEICKFHRCDTVEKKIEVQERIVEELADVHIMIEQMKLLTTDECTFQEEVTKKLYRQLERISGGDI